MSRGGGAKTKRKKKSLRRAIWAVGAVPFPLPVHEADGPVRLMLCVARPRHEVLAFEVSDGDGDVDGHVVEVLRRAIEEPLVGRPGAPDRVFVASEGTAARIRQELGLDVAVGSTPEISRVATAFAAAASRAPGRSAQPSYLSGGVAPKTVERLLDAAVELHDHAPWDILTEDAHLRVDVPRLGFRGRGVVIGAAREDFGLILFPSDDAYEAFVDHADWFADDRSPSRASLDWVGVSYDPYEELPTRLAQELGRLDGRYDEHAVPWVTAMERGEPVGVLNERNALLVTLAVRALVRLLAEHEAVLFGEVDWPGPLSGRASDAGVEAVITLNELDGVSVFEDEAPADLDPRHVLDGLLVRRMAAFAEQRFGDAWRAHEGAFDPHPAIVQLRAPWSVYEHTVDGRRIVEHFLDAHDSDLEDEERAWLGAQMRSWPSVWEVVDIERGVAMTLRDLLTGEVRTVSERKGSRDVPVREAFLARIVDGGTASLLCGLHPRTLPPRPAAHVVKALRDHLRAKGEVAPARMRDPATARALLALWQAAVREQDVQAMEPPIYQNTDGDPLLFTTDRYRIATPDVPAAEAALAAIEGMRAPEADDAERTFVFSKPGNVMHPDWDNTTLGVVHVHARRQRLELVTNSIARADRLRALVEKALAPSIVHEARTHEDPASPEVRSAARAAKARRPAAPPSEAEQREVDAIVREMKARHYASWLDEPVPALGGATPRRAARTKKGREQVDLLLREIERSESTLPADQRFDVVTLRKELGWAR